MSEHHGAAKTAWLKVFILWFAGISAAMQFAKFSLSYNELLSHYQMGPTFTGAAISVVGIVGLIFGATASIFVGRVGYRKVLISSLFLGALMSLVQVLLPSFEVIMLTRILEGVSQLGVVIAAPTMISKLSAPQHRSITMGIWGTFFGVAFAISGSLGKPLLEQFHLSGLYLGHGLLIGAMALLVVWLIDSDEALYKSPQAEDSESYFRKLARIYRTPRTVLPALIFLFYTSTLISLLTYVPNFIKDPQLKTLMQILLPLLSTLGTFSAGALSQYIMRPQRVALMAYAGLAFGALVLSQCLSSTWLFCIIIGQMVLFAGMVPGAALSIVPKLSRNSDEQANSYGLIAQLGNLGATVGPPSYATIIAVYHAQGMISLVLGICAFGALFAWLALRIEKP